MQNNLDTYTEDVVEDLVDVDIVEGKYLTFFTDNQLFGVPIADVVQIVGIQKITPVPEFPLYAKGIINLRGSIIPVIDVRLKFNKQEIPYTEKTCIVVTNINETEMGFVVDSVDEVANISPNQISAPPRMSVDYANSYLTGIGQLQNKVVLLLNTNKMINDDDTKVMTMQDR